MPYESEISGRGMQHELSRRTILAASGLAFAAPSLSAVTERPQCENKAMIEYKGFAGDDTLRFHNSAELGSFYDLPRDKMHYFFLRPFEFLRHGKVSRGEIKATRHLPVGSSDSRAIGHHMLRSSAGPIALRDFIECQQSCVDGIVILHRGSIAYEAYPRMLPSDRHILCSVSKTFVGLILARMVDQKLVDANSSLKMYLPEVLGSGWEHVRIRDILDMASGIEAVESEAGAVTDPNHPYYAFEATLGYLPNTKGDDRSTYDIVARYKQKRPAGEKYEYSSVNTFVLAWLAERISGLSFHDLLSRDIWRHVGAEDDAMLMISPRGAPAADGGISCRLRDLARYGLLYADRSRGNTKKIVSDRHMAAVQREGRKETYSAGRGQETWPWPSDDQPVFNSWQWDAVWSDGDFYKGGWGGQGLLVSPRAEVVIAFFGTPDVGNDSSALEGFTREIAAFFKR